MKKIILGIVALGMIFTGCSESTVDKADKIEGKFDVLQFLEDNKEIFGSDVDLVSTMEVEITATLGDSSYSTKIVVEAEYDADSQISYSKMEMDLFGEEMVIESYYDKKNEDYYAKIDDEGFKKQAGMDVFEAPEVGHILDYISSDFEESKEDGFDVYTFDLNLKDIEGEDSTDMIDFGIAGLLDDFSYEDIKMDVKFYFKDYEFIKFHFIVDEFEIDDEGDMSIDAMFEYKDVELSLPEIE